MSGKYFWDGEDMADITGHSGATGNNYPTTGTTLFKNVPGVISATTLPGYETYTSRETNPPFYDNGVSIFRNIKVAKVTKTTDGNMSIPTWANACKIYVNSKKGVDGSDGNDVPASNNKRGDNTNENVNTNHNRNNNHNTNRNNRNRWEANNNIRRRHNYHYSGASGGSGGNGANGYYYGTTKAFALNSTDVISCDFTAAHCHLQINNSSNSLKARIRIKHGTNGTNGSNAGVELKNKDTEEHDTAVGHLEATHKGESDDWDYTGHYDLIPNDQNAFRQYLQRDWNHTNYGSYHGTAGADGTAGSVDANFLDEFHNYFTGGGATTSTTPSITVYWFKI